MYIAVFITCANKLQAQKIARALVDRKLCACVNIIGKVNSFFRWKGKVDKASEVLLMAKSCRRKLPGIIKCVKSLHSYSVPEIIALPLAGGNNDYLEWIDGSVR
ncbi:MAG: divalent-cation tolerance protein CutA [Candidatus Omnitrophica bacterium]|jgi:periplasmic divalent cation tolerance protein|nr:divalent-cation tolerance protein CutA [Candidatus Omnitrophota bacterium]